MVSFLIRMLYFIYFIFFSPKSRFLKLHTPEVKKNKYSHFVKTFRKCLTVTNNSVTSSTGVRLNIG